MSDPMTIGAVSSIDPHLQASLSQTASSGPAVQPSSTSVARFTAVLDASAPTAASRVDSIQAPPLFSYLKNVNDKIRHERMDVHTGLNNLSVKYIDPSDPRRAVEQVALLGRMANSQLMSAVFMQAITTVQKLPKELLTQASS
jgi:hypothetical protein